MIPTYIHKDDLRDAWPWVKQGLEKVRARGHLSWIAEDIYCDCYEQRSMLWIFFKEDKPCAFMVLQPNGKNMHMWAAWSDGTVKDILEIGLQQAINISKQGGCTNLTFSSVRKGWEHKARELGFTPDTWKIDIQENNNAKDF